MQGELEEATVKTFGVSRNAQATQHPSVCALGSRVSSALLTQQGLEEYLLKERLHDEKKS